MCAVSRVSGAGADVDPAADEETSDFSEDDGFSDASAESSISGTRLTARQRAKEMGGKHGMELQSLPNSSSRLPLAAFSTWLTVRLHSGHQGRWERDSQAHGSRDRTQAIRGLAQAQVAV